jgi:hypothetical protein
MKNLKSAIQNNLCNNLLLKKSITSKIYRKVLCSIWPPSINGVRVAITKILYNKNEKS